MAHILALESLNFPRKGSLADDQYHHPPAVRAVSFSNIIGLCRILGKAYLSVRTIPLLTLISLRKKALTMFAVADES